MGALLILSLLAGALTGRRLLRRAVPAGTMLAGEAQAWTTAGAPVLTGLLAASVFAAYRVPYALLLCAAAGAAAWAAGRLVRMDPRRRTATLTFLLVVAFFCLLSPLVRAAAVLTGLFCLVPLLMMPEYPDRLLQRRWVPAWRSPFWRRIAAGIALLLLALDAACRHDPILYVQAGHRHAAAILSAALASPDAGVRERAACEILDLDDPDLLAALEARRKR